MSDADNFFNSSAGFSSARFKEIGDSVTGFVFYEPDVRQQLDFETREPLTWRDGSPRMQMVVVLHSQELAGEEGEDDEGHRTLYIKQGSNLQRAVGDAVRKAGAKKLEVGGKLRVKYEGDGTPPRKGFSAPKVFSALYRPPAPKPDEDEDFLSDEDKADLEALAGQQSKPNGSRRVTPAPRPKAEEIPF